jgi:ubiquinone/menaquinone biosynthesis C-methylase UbiE
MWRTLWHRFLRLFFRLLYNELAWTYDAVAWLVSLGRWRAWGRTTLAHLQGSRILELGHGPGHLLKALQERGFEPFGVDLSARMGRQARERLKRAGAEASLVQARAQALPFRAASFDSVVATFPTDYIIDPRTLGQVQRLLKPKGRLVVATAVRFKGEGVLSRFLAWLYDVTGQGEPHPDAFTSRFANAGLSLQTMWEEVGDSEVMVVIAARTS